MKKLLLLIFCFSASYSFSQKESTFWVKSDTLHKKRRNAVVITESVLGGATLIGLDRLWYSDYPRRNFHFANDNNQWKQMDKVGHIMTSILCGQNRYGSFGLGWS